MLIPKSLPLRGPASLLTLLIWLLSVGAFAQTPPEATIKLLHDLDAYETQVIDQSRTQIIAARKKAIELLKEQLDSVQASGDSAGVHAIEKLIQDLQPEVVISVSTKGRSVDDPANPYPGGPPLAANAVVLNARTINSLPPRPLMPDSLLAKTNGLFFYRIPDRDQTTSPGRGFYLLNGYFGHRFATKNAITVVSEIEDRGSKLSIHSSNRDIDFDIRFNDDLTEATIRNGHYAGQYSIVDPQSQK